MLGRTNGLSRHVVPSVGAEHAFDVRRGTIIGVAVALNVAVPKETGEESSRAAWPMFEGLEHIPVDQNNDSPQGTATLEEGTVLVLACGPRGSGQRSILGQLQSRNHEPQCSSHA